MAANKFAAMLQRSAHSITVVLVYAVLEWILIFLLLLSSTLSYLTEKFAACFGLKPPCTWCSRIDRVLQPDRNAHFCDEHAREVSRLGYCSNHRRLAESGRLCSNCSPSRLADNAPATTGFSASIGFFTWVSESVAEDNEKKDNCRCSCCDESLSKKLDLPCLHFKPSWDILHHIWKTRVVNDAKYEEFEFSAAHKTGNKTEQVVEDKNGDNLALNDEDQLLSDTESFSFGPIVEEDCSISVSNFPRYANEGSGCQRPSFPEDELQQSCRVNLKDPVLTLQNDACSDTDPPKLSNQLDSLTTSEFGEEDQVGEYDSKSEQLISETETRTDEEEKRVFLITDDGREDNLQADADEFKVVVPDLVTFPGKSSFSQFILTTVILQCHDENLSSLKDR